MTNYDLEEAELIVVQIILSVILLFTTIISITLSYDFLMKLEKKEHLYTEKEATIILIFNNALSQSWLEFLFILILEINQLKKNIILKTNLLIYKYWPVYLVL